MASEDPPERPRRGLVSRVVAALIAAAAGVACSGSTFTGTNPSDAGAGGTAGEGSGGTSSGGTTSTGGTSSGGRGGASSGGDGGSGDSGGIDAGGNGGSGDASGNGGSGNVTGDAGDSGTGGDASAGSGGSVDGGSAGQGGVAGAGGSLGGAGGALGGSGGSGSVAGAGGGIGAECQTAADCQLVSDCCRCEAEPKGTGVPACELFCVIDQCGSKQIAPEEVACVFGRCVIDRSCDRSRVTCKIAEPVCPEGSVPSVEGSCYGPCLPATECSAVTGCDDCTEPEVCVRNEAQLQTYGCVLPPQGCTKGSYCGCLGACVGPFGVCAESESAVGCACPSC